MVVAICILALTFGLVIGMWQGSRSMGKTMSDSYTDAAKVAGADFTKFAMTLFRDDRLPRSIRKAWLDAAWDEL